MMRNLSSFIKPKRLIAEATLTASPTAIVINRASINSRVWEALQFAMHVGAGGITFDATNYIALKLEDSDNGSAYAAVTNANALVFGAGNPAGTNFAQAPDTNGFARLINAAHASADSDPFVVDYVGAKQYVRATIVFGGAHATGTLVGLNANLGYPNIMPVV